MTLEVPLKLFHLDVLGGLFILNRYYYMCNEVNFPRYICIKVLWANFKNAADSCILLSLPKYV